MNRVKKLVFAALLAIGASTKLLTDCGPYPFEFQSLCPQGVMIAACRSDGNWEFVGCWEF